MPPPAAKSLRENGRMGGGRSGIRSTRLPRAITTYSDGTQRYTGAFKQRIINLATGKFIDVNSPGPVIIETHPDGSATERDFGPQFSRPPGQLLLTTGPVVYEYDPAGNIVSFTQRGGTTQDVCALLA